MSNRITRALTAPLAVILCVAGLATAAGAQRSRSAATPANEHAQIVQEFGGEVGGPLGQLVDQVGARVAARAGGRVNPDFTLLNSPVANAFATPSGRVYVTRQLLALMNSEDELAFVLGHEAGHIAARHSAERQRGSVLTQILTGLAGVVTGSNLASQVVGTVGQTYLAGFSRNQEFESDQLGVRYIAQAGYDPNASAEILETLGAYSAQQARFAGRDDDQRAAPSWSRTHPLSAERVTRARREAQSASRGAAPLSASDRYLAAVDNLTFDDDPTQGIVEGNRFLHPDLRFAFDVPQGYGIQNGTRAVQVSGREGQAIFSTGAYNGQLESFLAQAVQAVAGQGASGTTRPQPLTVNGLRALATTTRARSGNSNVDLTVVAYEFSPTQAYYFATIAPAGRGVGQFDGMIRSVRPLSAQEAGAIRPRVIDVVTAGRADTVATLARRMAYTSYQVERFRVVNGLDSDDVVQPGQRVKLVVFAPRR